MTKELYRKGNYKTDRTTFGGYVTNGDFCTEYPQKKGEYIDRIFSDWAFDERCRKNAESRKRRNDYKRGYAKWD